MQTLAKLLIGAIGLVVAIAVAVVLAVVFLVDPDDYRGVIADTVERQTGRSLLIEGPLGLKKFPCCAITLGRTELGNPPGFDAGRFAILDAAELELRVWPLLTRREVVIGRVLLDGLEADLVRRADGSSNWDFSGAAGEPAPAPRPGEAGEASRVDLALSSIAGIDVRRARISYTDATTGADYLVEDLALQTGPISAEKPFDLRSQLAVTDRSDGTRAEIELRARALADVAASAVTLRDLKAALELSGPALPARRTRLGLVAAELAIDASSDTTRASFGELTADVTLDELPDVARRVAASLRAPGLEAELGEATTAMLPALSGSLDITGLEGASPAESLTGSFTVSGITLRQQQSTRIGAATLEATLAVAGKALPGGKADITAVLAQLDLDPDAMAGSFGRLEASVRGAGLNATLAGAGRFGDSRADASGTLRLEPFSPRELLATLGEQVPVTADPEVLKRLSGTAGWFQRGAALGLRDIDFTLDDTRLRGSLEQDGATPPMTRFDLQLDRIDLDRYLAPAPGQPAGRRGEETPAPPAELPLETIRDLRLAGRAQVGQLTLSGVQMTSVDLTINADRGVLRLAPTRATLYGGTYEGKVTVDATGPQGQLTLDQRLAGVQASPLLTDLAGVTQLSGLLGATLTGSATGRTDQDLLRNLTGNLALDLADGYFEGMDLWYEIMRARSLLRRQTPAARSGPNRTPINQLTINGRMADGVLSSDQLAMQIPFVQLSGRGGLDLLSRGLDYDLQARITGMPRAADGEELADLRNVTIPLTIKGGLDSPRVGVDMAGLVRGAATEALRDRVLDRLGGGRDQQPRAGRAAPDEAGEGDEAPAAAPAEPEKPRDMLRRSLRDLIDR
jgi:AsmA protein